MSRFRPALRDQGVTEQQWRIMRALAHSGPTEVTALAEATFLRPPSLSRILPDLEARGFISRKQLESDRRCSLVNLEPVGLKLIAAHAPDSDEVYEQIATAFGRQRLDELFALLNELEVCLARDTEPNTAAVKGTKAARRRA